MFEITSARIQIADYFFVWAINSLIYHCPGADNFSKSFLFSFQFWADNILSGQVTFGSLLAQMQTTFLQ